MKEMYDLGSNKRITYQFHYENIPDWVKHDYIYSMYYPNIGGEKDVTGQSILGHSDYRLTYDGKLGRSISSQSGGYTL